MVGVHGVGNHRPGDTADQARHTLAGIWCKHLRRGRLGAHTDTLELTVAYYAHQLHAPGRQGVSSGLSDLPPDAEDMLRAWLAEFDLPAGTAQGPGTWPLRQALAWIAERQRLAPRMVEQFVTIFFREVATYLRTGDGDTRRAAREEVAHTIRTQQPQVVLAHSLGSVVAYEALWAHPDLNVNLLVTLGSPLALPHAVFHRLMPAPQTDHGACPPGVRRWVNLADPGDLVALPPRGVSQRFHGVDIDEHNIIHAFDFHLAANYLTCHRLADVLHQYIDT